MQSLIIFSHQLPHYRTPKHQEPTDDTPLLLLSTEYWSSAKNKSSFIDKMETVGTKGSKVWHRKDC